jgi:hypothetical protein
MSHDYKRGLAIRQSRLACTRLLSQCNGIIKEENRDNLEFKRRIDKVTAQIKKDVNKAIDRGYFFCDVTDGNHKLQLLPISAVKKLANDPERKLINEKVFIQILTNLLSYGDLYPLIEQVGSPGNELTTLKVQF